MAVSNCKGGLHCKIFYWRLIFSAKWAAPFPESFCLPSTVSVFWCPSSKPSADAGYVRAPAFYSGSEAEPGHKGSAALQLSGAAPVQQGRLTPQCSPASRFLGTHPACALPWAAPPVAITGSWDRRWPRQWDSSASSPWVVPAMGRHQRHNSLLAGLCLSLLPLQWWRQRRASHSAWSWGRGSSSALALAGKGAGSRACGGLPSWAQKTRKPEREVKLPFLEHGNAEGVFHAPAAREVQRAAEIPRCFR